MRTAEQTECSKPHEFNGKRGAGIWDVYTLADGHSFTVCAHPVGQYGYCGAVISADPGHEVVICCGKHRES